MCNERIDIMQIKHKVDYLLRNKLYLHPFDHVEGRSTVRPGAEETQNYFFHIPQLFISLNEGEISE